MRRTKVAAIGNTPFQKKVRVMMAARFEHHGDKDINAISRDQLDETMGAYTDGKVPGKGHGGFRRKSKYTA